MQSVRHNPTGYSKLWARGVVQNVIQREASGSCSVRKERSCVRGKQGWFGEVTGAAVPAVGAAGWREGGSGQGHRGAWALLPMASLVQSSPRN